MDGFKYFIPKSIRIGLVALVLSVMPPVAYAVSASVEDVRALARLYSAAFDRNPDLGGLNFWVNSYEVGRPLVDIAKDFYNSAEFTTKYGPLDNRQYVDQLYLNVLRRPGEEDGVNFWTGDLSRGAISKAQVLAGFSDSAENVIKTTETFADMRFENGQWTFARATNNLIATSLEIDSPDPRIGYPLKLSLGIDALEFTKDVSVTFYAFDQTQVDAEPFDLGVSVIAEVVEGSDAYQIEINLPTTIKNPKSYFIGASIDSADVIAETNEEDNQTSTETALSPAESPNLFIEFMEPDRTAIVLDRTAWDYVEQIQSNGVIASDAGGTVRWGGQGIEEVMDVEAFAVLRLNRTDKSSLTSLDVPLYLWNSDVQRYMNAYGIDPVLGGRTGVEEWLPVGQVGQLTTSSVSEFDLRSVHLDFYFPGRLAKEIEIALRQLPVFLDGPILPPPDLAAEDIQSLRSFLFGADLEDVSSEFCVRIRPANRRVVESSTDDNITCSPLRLLLPPVAVRPPPPPVPPPVPPLHAEPVNSILYSVNYFAGWPGDFFGVSVDVSASSSVDTNGVIVNGNVDVPVTIFGGTFQFVGIDARAQVLPISDRFARPEDQPTPGFNMTISSLDQIIFTSPYPPTGSTGELSASWSIEVPDVEEEAKAFYYIGPVKVTLDAGIAGSVGIAGEIEFGSPTLEGINYKTTFFNSAEVFVKAYSNLLVGKIGVEGVVTLIKNAFPIENRSTINVYDSRHSDGTSEVVIVDDFTVKHEISGPEGALNAYAEVGGGKKCNWGIFSFVCRLIPTIKYTLTLLEWEPFEKEEKILKREIDLIDIVTRPDGSVVYYGDK